MWRSIEEVLRELKEEGIIEDIMKSENGLPPGFRFHPTDEELITCYLASKVFNNNNNNNVSTNIINNNINNNATNNMFLSNYFCSCAQIAEVDLTRCEPWDLPESAKMGEKEWYLFSLRDRKYPSGLRTNRATETGYWKATGKDRQVYATSIIATNASGGGGGGSGVLIGMKKTLVFYQGRAPRGAKTKWVMHEYRLDGHFSAFRLSSKEEWVICRIFQKNGEKKASPMIHHPPLPLSPFLRTLPPLQELTTTTTTTTSTMTQTVADNSLLHSLLLNPLPNFSSISGSDPIFPSTTPSADMNISSTLFNSLPRLTSNTAAAATAIATAAAAATKQENWLDRICPQEHQTQHYQNQNQYQYHDDHIFDQTVENHHDEKEMLLLNHTVNNQYPAESWCFH